MTDTKARLKAAYNKALERMECRPGADVDAFVDTAVHGLLGVCTGLSGQAAGEFSKAGPTKTRKELDKLAKCFEAAASTLDKLHEPAIDALASIGIVRGPSARMWRAQAEIIRNVPFDASVGPGRPRNDVPALPIIVATYVISGVEEITGKSAKAHADSKSGARGFIPLVREIFGALGIEASAKAAKEACRKATE